MITHVLYDWKDIKNDFIDNLLLGNGASIAIDKRLSYKSLYKEVSCNSLLNRELLSLFEHYASTNFELILRLLLETSRVNKILNIADDKTNMYYLELRSALIKTIRKIHPSYDEAKVHFSQITELLCGFKQVMSLNYDLLVYWAMLAFNEKNGKWLKDCFVHGEFESNYRYLSSPLPPAKGATLVFYPHGSLFLATEPFGGECKLQSTDEDHLLDSVLAKWEQGNYIPLFVSEGTSEEKLRSIKRNNYLNIVYNSVLSQLTNSLVIYGWSFGNQDQHILNALPRNRFNKIAISVYTKDTNWESYVDEVIDKIKRKLCNQDISNIYFFDAESHGCWIY